MFVSGAFLDGSAGIRYARLQALYESWIVDFAREYRRKEDKLQHDQPATPDSYLIDPLHFGEKSRKSPAKNGPLSFCTAPLSALLCMREQMS